LSQGLLDAASRAAMSAIEEARGADHPTVLCMALAWAVSMVLLNLGNLDEAELYGSELIDHAYKHAMRPFYAAGHCVRGSLASKRGHPENGIESFRSGLAEMREMSYLLFYPYFLTNFAAVLGAVGSADEGLVQIEEALGLALEIDYRWFLPEIWRTKGELLARHGADGSAAVITDLFHKSMSLAREQQALYWELSAALSFAEFMRDQGRDREAHAVLAPVYGRFTEGFSASKMKAARALLDQLS
jgi:non-specific serine/threonine protein kinase